MHLVREIWLRHVKCAAAREGFISFHIERSEIFHNFRKKIISRSATPNISLERIMVLFFCTIPPKKTDVIGLYPKGQFYLPTEKNTNRRLIFCGLCVIKKLELNVFHWLSKIENWLKLQMSNK